MRAPRGADQVWHTWVSTGTGDGYLVNNGTVISNGTISGGYTTGTTITYDPETVWRGWSGEVHEAVITEEQRQRRRERDAEILEQRQAREREAAELRQQRAAREAKKQEAERRAAELLKLVLTDKEWKRYQKTGKIIITGSEGTLYEVGQDHYQGNVYPLLSDRRHTRLLSMCAHPNMGDRQGGRLPNMDAWVAQVLALKHDENEFLRLANVHNLLHSDGQEFISRMHRLKQDYRNREMRQAEDEVQRRHAATREQMANATANAAELTMQAAETAAEVRRVMGMHISA